MGCVSSSSYCNRSGRGRARRQMNTQCNSTNSLASNQVESNLPTENPTRNRASTHHQSPSFSNLTSNSFQSTASNSNPNSTAAFYSYYVPPTGKNKRLKKDFNKYFKSDKRISESQLKAKRDEFWDTAPAFDGKPEIWAALKAAVDALESKNYQLAQAIIDSANIILPNGLLNDCYDELGNRYQIPVYVLAKPSNLSKSRHKNEQSSNDLDSNSSSFKEKCSRKKKKCTDDIENDSVTSEENLDGQKKAKSKPTTSSKALNEVKPEDLIQIKLRISTINQDTNNDIKMTVNLNQSVLCVKRKLKELVNIEARNQRFYFGGKLMRDKDKLKAHKLKKNVVIQVIVREQINTSEAIQDNQNAQETVLA